MGKVIVVTSDKGGVGKTTSTAAIGAALARSGEKVVVVDFDVGLRNLDLVMGAERRVVHDLVNVVQGVVKLPPALIRDKRIETLFLLPASQTRDKDALTEEGVGRVIAELRTMFDWVICDSPAGIERGPRSPCGLPMPRSSSPIRKWRRCATPIASSDCSIPRP
jgi:septum site-determining protein MinD